MKYTSEYINSLSFDEYRRLIVKELNDNVADFYDNFTDYKTLKEFTE